MKIYQINLNNDRRIGTTVTSLPEMPSEDYFLVVHPDRPQESVNEDLPQFLKDNCCKGILYVKGIGYAGVNIENVRQIEGDTDHRVHFYSKALGSGDAEDEQNRFQKFFKEIRRSKGTVNWEILDPQREDYTVCTSGHQELLLETFSNALDHILCNSFGKLVWFFDHPEVAISEQDRNSIRGNLDDLKQRACELDLPEASEACCLTVELADLILMENGRRANKKRIREILESIPRRF